MATGFDLVWPGKALPASATPRISSPMAGASLFLLLAVVSLAIDLPVAQLRHRDDIPGDVIRIFNLAEVFAHGSGVALVLLTALVLDPARRRQVARVAATAYGAGLLANGGKLFVARVRPDDFPETDPIWHSFQAWLPILPGQLSSDWAYDVQGFPSAHAATAFGLAWGLTALYPQGRWLFLFFAVLASVQRMLAGAHFLSDVLAGAALGCLVAGLLRDGTHGARLFDRWEQCLPLFPRFAPGGKK